MNNKGILYAWDRGIGKAFLRGGRLLGFWASEQSGRDSVKGGGSRLREMVVGG